MMTDRDTDTDTAASSGTSTGTGTRIGAEAGGPVADLSTGTVVQSDRAETGDDTTDSDSAGLAIGDDVDDRVASEAAGAEFAGGGTDRGSTGGLGSGLGQTRGGGS